MEIKILKNKSSRDLLPYESDSILKDRNSKLIGLIFFIYHESHAIFESQPQVKRLIHTFQKSLSALY